MVEKDENTNTITLFLFENDGKDTEIEISKNAKVSDVKITHCSLSSHSLNVDHLYQVLQ